MPASLTPTRKTFAIETTADADDLKAKRQVRVVVSTGQIDRTGDVVVQSGINVDNFKSTRTVLWNHDQDHPVAACIEIGIKNGRLEALTQFPPEGVSQKSDEVYGLLTHGVVNAASIGFLPLEVEAADGKNPRKGLRIDEADLLEFSFVSVPANPGAIVMERSMTPKRKTAVPLSRKGLYAVSQLAYLLAELGYQVDGAVYERDCEGDASAVPDMLTDCLRQLGAALIAMTNEEVAELIANHGADADDDLAVVSLLHMAGLEKRYVVTSDESLTDEVAARLEKQVAAFQTGVRPLFLHKGLSIKTVYVRALAPKTKAGRKISAANAETIKSACKSISDGHDAMMKMLDDMDDDDGETSKSQKTDRQREVEALRATA